MDKETRILEAIMSRYRSLSTLKVAMWDDEDTVLVNLDDDLNSGDGSSEEIFEEEVLNYIHKILG
jgi:hypothetical protein